jgi:DNA-binding MarR family transcriptional regulator
LHLVERVWAEACDAEWHSLREIARRIRSSYGRVAMVVDFLEKYGFIQSHFSDGRWMRISPEAPPMELADELRSLLDAHGMDLPSRYIF